MRMIGKRFQAVAVALVMITGMAAAVPAMAAERYLHVRVQDGDKGQNVNVNVPLSMAEKILPAINHDPLHNGIVTVHQADMQGVDVRQILDAVRTAPDGQFVTINNTKEGQSVRVAKSNGNIVVHVRDERSKQQDVDITVPMTVINALFSTAKRDELNVAAALQSLADTGNGLLVVVHNADQNVRIWVDSNAAPTE
ncbi:MAG TPA: hypothetical protein VGR36_02805 [Candidatus Acidoferrales bacterium]|nr:hypothetical protein [Candidatus Acidoferrales bacterium]